MPILFKRFDDETFEFSEKRLKIYQRLLRHYNQDPMGLERFLQQLRGLTQITHDQMDLVYELQNVGLLKVNDDSVIVINEDEAEFLNFVVTFKFRFNDPNSASNNLGFFSIGFGLNPLQKCTQTLSNGTAIDEKIEPIPAEPFETSACFIM